MLKAFFRDGAIYGVAKVLTGGITLLSLPIYTHALPPAEYGVIDVLTSIATIAHVTVALEIAQGLGRHVMAPEAEGRRHEYASTALWFTLAGYSLFAALLFPLAETVSIHLFGSPTHVAAVRLATMVIWSTGIFYLVQNLLRFSRRPAHYALVAVLFSSISLGVTAALLGIWKLGVAAVFAGQLAAGLVATVLGLWFSRASIRLTFDRRLCREMLTFSIPLVPSGIGIMLCMYVDRFAVLRLLSVDELGLYGVGFRLASIIVLAVAGFDAALAPLIYQNHKDQKTPADLARMFQWFLAFAAGLLLFQSLFADALVRVMAPVSYAGAARLVFPLSTSMLVASLYNFSPGLWIAKRTIWIAGISIASGLTNLGLNFVLIPRIGLVGAAIGTLLSAFAGCACHFVLGQRSYPVPFKWGRIAGGALVTALVGGAASLGVFGDDAMSARGLALRAALWLASSIAATTMLLGRSEISSVVGTARAAVGRFSLPKAKSGS